MTVDRAATHCAASPVSVHAPFLSCVSVLQLPSSRKRHSRSCAAAAGAFFFHALYVFSLSHGLLVLCSCAILPYASTHIPRRHVLCTRHFLDMISLVFCASFSFGLSTASSVGRWWRHTQTWTSTSCCLSLCRWLQAADKTRRCTVLPSINIVICLVYVANRALAHER